MAIKNSDGKGMSNDQIEIELQRIQNLLRMIKKDVRQIRDKISPIANYSNRFTEASKNI